MKELTSKLLGIHEFPQCIGIIDDTHLQLSITRIISTERIIFPWTFKLCAIKNIALKRSDEMADIRYKKSQIFAKALTLFLIYFRDMFLDFSQ